MSKKKQKEYSKAFQTELADIADAIVDKLLNPSDVLPEGFIVDYEINDLGFLARILCKKLPIKLQRMERKPVSKPEGNILLWHGTSLKRAKSILESGFKGRRHGVFFSSNIITSLGYAEGSASEGYSEPAIFSAYYDLGKFRYGKDFKHQYHFIFRPGIASQIVKHLLTCQGLYSIGGIITNANRFNDRLTSVSITQNAGNAGIAYWLNSYLELDNSECISENDPIVRHVKNWVDAQYENGRTTPISDEEMLNAIKEILQCDLAQLTAW